MYRYLIVLVSLFLGAPLESQNFWLKAYPVSTGLIRTFNIVYDANDLSTPARYRYENDGILGTMMGVEMEDSNGWSLEVALSGFGIKRSRDITDFIIANRTFVLLGRESAQTMEIQMEAYKQFHIASKKAPKLSWGFFLNFRNAKKEFFPQADIKAWHPLQESRLVASVGFVPRIQFNLLQRLQLDFNTFFQVASFGYAKSYAGNPALTPTQATSDLVEFDLFGRYGVRAGISWRLNKTNRQTAVNN